MEIRQRIPTKLCNLKVGDAVYLIGAGGTLRHDPFIVCAAGPGDGLVSGLKVAGLYTDGRTLFLVNLRTGVATTMPHLSSWVIPATELELVDSTKWDDLDTEEED